MKFTVAIQKDEDGVFVAICLSMQGCVSQGATEAEAEENLRYAIRECLAVRTEQGLPPIAPTRELEVHV
ncbi:MAG: type II toxin-antitoxin system HicB family antitoxin [Acidobacteria bacterium]|nr:type II toxin-antitoxin system HicB family antitoxin [Acidobacteriota bacterium]